MTDRRTKEGKRLGKKGVKRHRKIFCDNIQSITKPAICRLATRCSQVKCIFGLIYEKIRGILKIYLENVICDIIIYIKHVKRKIMIAMDIVYAMKRQGRTLYRFGD